jgi:hypothetical protein
MSITHIVQANPILTYIGIYSNKIFGWHRIYVRDSSEKPTAAIELAELVRGLAADSPTRSSSEGHDQKNLTRCSFLNL